MLRKVFFDDYGIKPLFVIPFAVLLSALLLFLGSIFVGLISASACNEYAALNPQFDFNWTFLNRCLVRTEGMDIWIPAENIRTLVQ